MATSAQSAASLYRDMNRRVGSKRNQHVNLKKKERKKSASKFLNEQFGNNISSFCLSAPFSSVGITFGWFNNAGLGACVASIFDAL